MKGKMVFARMAFPTPKPEAEVAGIAVTRPRNANMDAFARHASTNEACAFPNVCDAVSTAVRKAKDAR